MKGHRVCVGVFVCVGGGGGRVEGGGERIACRGYRGLITNSHRAKEAT